MRYLLVLIVVLTSFSSLAGYERNKAVPVEKVLFGKVESVRAITQQELVNDRNHGWHKFGGALIGGAIGNQFGDGSGQVAATILGAIIGANVTDARHATPTLKYQRLVELMIVTEEKQRFMVLQDNDPAMQFTTNDKVRLVYLQGGTVRVDKAY